MFQFIARGNIGVSFLHIYISILLGMELQYHVAKSVTCQVGKKPEVVFNIQRYHLDAVKLTSTNCIR